MATKQLVTLSGAIEQVNGSSHLMAQREPVSPDQSAPNAGRDRRGCRRNHRPDGCHALDASTRDCGG